MWDKIRPSLAAGIMHEKRSIVMGNPRISVNVLDVCDFLFCFQKIELYARIAKATREDGIVK